MDARARPARQNIDHSAFYAKAIEIVLHVAMVAFAIILVHALLGGDAAAFANRIAQTIGLVSR